MAFERVLVASESVETGTENCDDSHEVSDKFRCWTGIQLMQNHDLSTGADNEPFNEFEAETSQSVPVADNNRETFASHCAFQYGTKTFSLEVESAPNVSNDFAIRVAFSEIGGLSVEVGFLLRC